MCVCIEGQEVFVRERKVNIYDKGAICKYIRIFIYAYTPPSFSPSFS